MCFAVVVIVAVVIAVVDTVFVVLLGSRCRAVVRFAVVMIAAVVIAVVATLFVDIAAVASVTAPAVSLL